MIMEYLQETAMHIRQKWEKDRFFGGRGAVYFTNFNMPKLQEAVLYIIE